MNPVLNGALAALVIGGAAFLGHSPGDTEPVPSSAVSSLSASETLEITATHEAGHVAALREFGIPVWHVDAADDGSGRTTYPDHFYGDRVRDAYDAAVSDVAGQESAAEWLVTHHGLTRDQALAATEDAAQSDLMKLRVDAARAGITEQQARDRARDIIGDHRADIARTAQTLIEHNQIGDPR